MSNQAPSEDGLLLEALRELDHARVFIRTREKMHPEGVRQFDEVWAKVRRHLELKARVSVCAHKNGSWSIGNTRACNDCNQELP